jgi:hypothetical protein
MCRVEGGRRQGGARVLEKGAQDGSQFGGRQSKGSRHDQLDHNRAPLRAKAEKPARLSFLAAVGGHSVGRRAQA